MRYLSGKSLTESRLGLLFNGLFKVPMQFLILLTGVMVLVFHQFEKPPVFFNTAEWDRVKQTSPRDRGDACWRPRRPTCSSASARRCWPWTGRSRRATTPARPAPGWRSNQPQTQARDVHQRARALVGKALPGAETRDTDYVFLSFVLQWLPQGLIGLLLAVILCAAMSSSASEIAALGSTTVVDFYKRSFRPRASDHHYLRAAQVFTVAVGRWWPSASRCSPR